MSKYTLSFLFTFFFFLFSSAFCKIIHIPQTQPGIQAGINAAVNGDTVLVADSTYYENINFNEKAITVASYYIMDLDTNHINNTIIDGSQPNEPWKGSVVSFTSGEDSNTILAGFTLRNGSSTDMWYSGYGGGVFCNPGSPVLENLVIKNNTTSGGFSPSGGGGGIYCGNHSDPIITNVKLIDNSALSAHGGGIYCQNSSPTLMNVLIQNDTSGYGGGISCDNNSQLTLIDVIVKNNNVSYVGGFGSGGGIYCDSSSLNLTNVTIRDNTAEAKGGGICLYQSSLVFNNQNRCNIYLNKAPIGTDLYSINSPISEIVVNTFTVLNPTDYYAFPLTAFTFDIFNAKITQVTADLYVNPAGDNNNGGLSPSEPLKNIWFALSKILADSLNPLTIHLSNGYYRTSETGEEFPIFMPDYVSISGESQDSVKLDAENIARVFYCDGNKGNILKNLTISGGSAPLFSGGGGIYCNESSPEIMSVTIQGNSHAFIGIGGGGIFCTNSSNPRLFNVLIHHNNANSGGGIYCENNSNPHLVNTTVTGNSAGASGGGIVCKNNSKPILVNTILWNNNPQEIYFENSGSANSITVAYSDIQDSLPGIITNNNGIVHWLDGNIAIDPMVVNPDSNDFRLQADSPCIDAGIQDTFLVYNNDLDTLSVPPLLYLGFAPDMGAYEFDPSGSIQTQPIVNIPNSYTLHQNYPNPFNPGTTIEFDLPNSGPVTLKIYNILGEEVATLLSATLLSGSYVYEWDATGMASGVYFYRLNTGNFTCTKKMLLVR